LLSASAIRSLLVRFMASLRKSSAILRLVYPSSQQQRGAQVLRIHSSIADEHNQFLKVTFHA
jgi:hypothetical protein